MLVAILSTLVFLAVSILLVLDICSLALWMRRAISSVWERVWPLLSVTSARRSFTRVTSWTRSSVDSKSIIQTGVELTADTAGSLRAISDVSAQINTISDQLTAAVRGQELALAAMEERIASISAIADRNLQNAGETEQSSGSLAREAEALQSLALPLSLQKLIGVIPGVLVGIGAVDVEHVLHIGVVPALDEPAGVFRAEALQSQVRKFILKEDRRG